MAFVSRSFKSGFFAGIFLSLGIVIGLIVSSNLGWLSIGTGDETVEDASTSGSAEQQTGVAGFLPQQPFVGIVKETTPAVVNISTTRVIRNQEGFPRTPFFEDPFFRRFFGDDFFRQFDVPKEKREQSLGSGVIVDPSGLIITNNHVISKADQIKVLLGDKREFEAKLLGTDPKTDIAVIKIKAENLPAIPWGNSDQLKVGEYVLAIGNPFGLNQTVTMGIISAVGRANVGIADYEDFIQTDAAINPGNSGGALVNVRGELIGINTAIFSQSGGYMGIGFAVPSNMARVVMESLAETGKVIRGWLGISIQDVDADLAEKFGLDETRGALVGDVMEGSPAEKAGIRPGDVIVTYNGRSVDSSTSLRNMVAQTNVGGEVKVKIIRDGKHKVLKITVGEFPREFAETGPGLSGGQDESAALVGLEVTDLTAEIARRLNLSDLIKVGVVILRVKSGSPADRTGLQRGDVILEVNNKSLENVNDFKRLTSRVKKDEGALLLVHRKGRKIFFVLKP
jgi:serine protease Do